MLQMPFKEFLINGDFKYIAVYLIFTGISVYHFIKKLQAKKQENDPKVVQYHNSKINNAAIWILTFGTLSLLGGLMKGFYFIGKSGGGSASLIFQGITYSLITPIFSILFFMICRILKGIFNPKLNRQLSTLLFILALSNIGFSQTNPKPLSLMEKIEQYTQEDLQSADNQKNNYNLACAYALTIQLDSTYYYLHIALEKDSSLWALADSDFYMAAKDERWAEIENLQLAKFQEQNNRLLKEPLYTKKLLRMIQKDQALDYYVDQAKAYYVEHAHAPDWYYPLGWMKQEFLAENYDELQELLATYGWPKYSTVGEIAADAPLLIINHHEDNAVRKKYLAQIKQACLDGEGSCMEFAKIQDRILVEEDRPQVYGMQFQYNAERKLEPFPIENPEQVDQRRSAIGLEPIKHYLKRKIDYDWTIEPEE